MLEGNFIGLMGHLCFPVCSLKTKLCMTTFAAPQCHTGSGYFLYVHFTSKCFLTREEQKDEKALALTTSAHCRVITHLIVNTFVVCVQFEIPDKKAKPADFYR